MAQQNINSINWKMGPCLINKQYLFFFSRETDIHTLHATFELRQNPYKKMMASNSSTLKMLIWPLCWSTLLSAQFWLTRALMQSSHLVTGCETEICSYKRSNVIIHVRKKKRFLAPKTKFLHAVSFVSCIFTAALRWQMLVLQASDNHHETFWSWSNSTMT